MRLVNNKFFRFFAFTFTFVLGIFAFWGFMFFLAVLDSKGVINKYNLPFETQEIILDIQCDKDDLICRGEKCRN